jgi:hypothetical protein
MKYLILIALGCLLWSCKKGNNPPKKTLPALSGTFTVYRMVDTGHLETPTSDNATDFTVLTLTGDTAYDKLNDGSYVAVPNYIPNYNSATYLVDTLSFTSSSAGIAIGPDFPLAGKFTYNLDDGYFKIANLNYSGTFAIKLIDQSTVELTIISIGNVETDGQTLFFKKEN